MARPKKTQVENEAVSTQDEEMNDFVGNAFFRPYKESRKDFVSRVAQAILLEAVKVGTNYKMSDLPEIAVRHANDLADRLKIED